MEKLKEMVDTALWPYKNWGKLDAKDKVKAVFFAAAFIVLPIYVSVGLGVALFK